MYSSSGLVSLDTNVLLLISRDNPISRTIVARLALSSTARAPIVSVVAMAELQGIAARRNWGSKRRMWMRQLYTQLNVIPIDPGPLVDEFVALDARQRSVGKSIGMHDTWIAATAKVYGATLITADSDFRNLDASYLDVELIDPQTGQPMP